MKLKRPRNKQAELMADVNQDDRVMKRRLNVRAESGLHMHQGSLVELAEMINETCCIIVQCVSLLISTLIGDAASFFFKVAFHLLIFFSPEHDLITLCSETKSTCTGQLSGAL